MARFERGALTEATLAHAANGIVAYSGVCTHQGCPGNQWSQEQRCVRQEESLLSSLDQN
jgi:Rieske Fe-S protein